MNEDNQEKKEVRDNLDPIGLKLNQPRSKGELVKMLKTKQDVKVQVKNWTNNSEVEFFRLKPNQARGRGELGKMFKVKQVNEKQVRGNLGEQIRLRTNTASLLCCGASSQSEVAIQNASGSVASRFLAKNRNGLEGGNDDSN